jgi:hypothetical protein
MVLDKHARRIRPAKASGIPGERRAKAAKPAAFAAKTGQMNERPANPAAIWFPLPRKTR